MGKRILIVGGVAGGASAAARARRISEDAEIIIFERGPHVSFSNCSLPFYLSGTVDSSDKLIMMTPERFKKQYNIEVRVLSDVIRICRDRKTIVVRDIRTGNEYEEHYDKLVLSPGAIPAKPRSIEGIQSDHVFTVRNVTDICNLKNYIDHKNVEKLAVIGGGFIGVEVAENLRKAGKQVSLIEAREQIMITFDYEMAQLLHKEMTDNGINLILNDGVKAIHSTSIELLSGRSIEAEAVVMAIGVIPETKLAADAGLDIGSTRSIATDQAYRTNDKDIYAVGDAIEVHNRLTGKPFRLALAGPAQKEARAAADNIFGMDNRYPGYLGSSVVRVFNLNAASTGMTERTAKELGVSYNFAYVIPSDRVSIMPGSSPMFFKLIFEVPTGRLLGAQAIGRGDAAKRIDVVAALIGMNGTLEDLKDVELCYAPLFGTAKDVVNYAALVGLNLLHGKYRQVPVTKVRELVESGAFIVDVREKAEFERGHLLNAKNIPLSEIRQRLDEIPHDVPVYVHCRTGQRSYNAVMMLQNKGYDNVFNVSGSFLGVSCYEYYNDLVTGRNRILTEYNFS